MEDFFHDLNAIFCYKTGFDEHGNYLQQPGMTIFSVLRAVMFTCLHCWFRMIPSVLKTAGPFTVMGKSQALRKNFCKKFT